MNEPTIQARLRRIVRDCDQAIVDGEWWAENRPEERPIDIESFRVSRAQAQDCLDALAAGDVSLLSASLARLYQS